MTQFKGKCKITGNLCGERFVAHEMKMKVNELKSKIDYLDKMLSDSLEEAERSSDTVNCLEQEIAKLKADNIDFLKKIALIYDEHKQEKATIIKQVKKIPRWTSSAFVTGQGYMRLDNNGNYIELKDVLKILKEVKVTSK